MYVFSSSFLPTLLGSFRPPFPSPPLPKIAEIRHVIVVVASEFFASAQASSRHKLTRHTTWDTTDRRRHTFLKNLLPLKNQTALRWLSDGLQGGQQEFIDQWNPNQHHPKEIESGITFQNLPVTSDHQLDEQQEHISNPSSNSPALELLRLGRKSYLCLIPPPPSFSSQQEDQTPITPTHSWSLLQPLSGTCLYHRQAWFTYSYCHNVHVRQFRELPVTNRQETGERIVEEDPEWESYTLGRSPLASEATENIPHDELAIANNLELVHHQTAGQRYLVQRWSDGTICDKTGRPREVEIQFHCSMTMTDTIIFVKETRTCEYVLVIHTPRLCGEPGFKSHLEQVPEAEIQCREVLNDNDDNSSESLDSSSSKDQDNNLKQHPFRRIPRPPVIPPTKTGEQGSHHGGKKSDGGGSSQEGVQILQKALEQLFGRTWDPSGDEQVDGEDPELGGGEQLDASYKRLATEMLRKMGVQVDWIESQSLNVEEEEDEKKQHDEL
ncbi:hypothetical protein Clacol_006297 [Clathrus columnatus]|uniref:Protein OS-9 homolog n=1 Tax=Clathrus columnatus TaxID=1419009 RepID=A0AAV5AGG3_9AGAM|nr:hypothetical protein Clacol_006297 [Clathrus columnatus]